MRSTPRIPAKLTVPAIAGLATAALLLDGYFGSGGGGLGAVFLGLFTAGGLAAEWAVGFSTLRYPRTLDLAFVSGADLRWRRADLMRRVVRTGGSLALLTLPAAAAMALWLQPPIADVLLLIAVTSGAPLLAGMIAWIAIPLIRPSRSAFPEPGEAASPWQSRWNRGVIRLTARMAGTLERIIPEPWATLAGRKARFFLRREGDIMVVALIAFSVLGAALVSSGRVAYAIMGALTAAALVFAWFRFQSAVPDACLREFAPCPTPARHAYQADLYLTGALAACFLSFLLLVFLRLEGLRGLSDLRLFQALLTVLVFAQLAAADNQRPGMDANTVLVLNLGYLGISGTLFMIPAWPALAALAAVLLLSHVQVSARLRTS